MNKEIRNKLFEEVKKRGLIKEQKSESEGGFKSMVSELLQSQTQVHIFHLQTKSYSEHKALQGYYEGIDGLVDSIIESYQGKHDIIKGYGNSKMVDYQSGEQVIKYLESLNDKIETGRKEVKESFIQNQIDTVQELIFGTLYKLKNLK